MPREELDVEIELRIFDSSPSQTEGEIE